MMDCVTRLRYNHYADCLATFRGRHMDSWQKDLIIAVAGGVICTALVTAFSAGFRWTAKASRRV